MTAAAVPARLGFVGLGYQGAQIVRRWLADGRSVAVHDVRAQAVAALVADGAVAADLARMGADCDAVGVCVVDDVQVEAVLLGSGGLIAAARAGLVVMIHSTISPALVRRVAAVAAARGVTVIDAPVSGGASAAGKAMSFMVGGPDDAVRRCAALFGDVVTFTGPAGSGMAAKLAHQLILCLNMLAAEQGGRLAAAAGLDPRIVDAVAHAGAAQSNVADRWSRRTMTRETAALLLKDLALCRDLAIECGITLAGIDEAMRFLEHWPAEP